MVRQVAAARSGAGSALGRRDLREKRGQMHAWLVLARRAAKLGVELLRKHGARGRLIRTDGRREIKILADTALDDVIIRFLKRESRFSILTEESGMVRQSRAEEDYCWIVDPLDGSFNHSRTIPLCAVCVALWRAGEPVLGVVHDPVHREVFSGIVGVGAWLNGRPIVPSDVREPGHAVLCTGFPVAADFSTTALGKFVHSVRGFKKVRLLGSAALSLAYVACGRVDAYAEREIQIWDIAAGAALVRAAGGWVDAKPGRQPTTRVVIATNGRIAATLPNTRACRKADGLVPLQSKVHDSGQPRGTIGPTPGRFA